MLRKKVIVINENNTKLNIAKVNSQNIIIHLTCCPDSTCSIYISRDHEYKGTS